MVEAKILHAARGNVHVFRYVGDIRYPLAPSLEAFVDRLFAQEVPVGLVFDLTDARIIDSTNLGLMARIANRLRQQGGPRVTIISPCDDLTQLLISMGFDEVFDLVHEGTQEQPLPANTVPPGDVNRGSLARVMLEAHRELIAMNAHNRELFRDVVAALEQEERNGAAGQG